MAAGEHAAPPTASRRGTCRCLPRARAWLKSDPALIVIVVPRPARGSFRGRLEHRNGVES